MKQNPQLQHRITRDEYNGGGGGPVNIPVGPRAPRMPRQRGGHDSGQQIAEQQDVQDCAALHRITRQHRVEAKSKTDQRYGEADRRGRQRCITENDVGPPRIQPRQHKRKAKAHHG